jgi:pimeloyl-ACP methyl ester carboxylesterase
MTAPLSARLRTWLGAAALIAVAAGGLPARAEQTPAVTSPSQLAAIGDRQVEFAVTRAPHSRATVVFENGLMLPMSTWQTVTSALADCCDTLTYHRAGVGLSAMAADPDRPQDVAGNLQALLRAQQLSPPYILVGHSLGGQYAQTFASRYPDQVKGLVLVDALPVGVAKPAQDFPWFTRLGLWLFAPEYARREIAAIHPMGEALLAGPRFDGRRVTRLVAHTQDSSPKAEGLLKDLWKGVILAEDFGVWANDPDEAEARMDQLYPQSTVMPVQAHHRVQEIAPDVVVEAIRRRVDADQSPVTLN